MNQFLRRLWYLLHLGRQDQHLADELEFHREMAARDGRTNLGNPLRLREESRDAWGWTWIDRLLQDLRYAGRRLYQSPGFSLAAILMLALGIGVNVAVFGFFNLVLLSALPVRDPDSLLSFQRRSPEAYASDLPYPAMAFYREHTRTLSAVLGLHRGSLAAENIERPLQAHFVTANTFAELGAPMTLGRALNTERDDASGAELVVVLSQGFWQRYYGANPGVIGRPIRLNRQTATIVGVAGVNFGGLTLSAPDVWVPISQQPTIIFGSSLLTSFDPGTGQVEMWGRLRPGFTPKAAEDELAQLAAELRRSHPNEMWAGERLASSPGGYIKLDGTQRGTGAPQSNRQKMLPIILLVSTLVLLILAVACANLGSLLLARGVARQREISIRVAIGAGIGRLIMQLFTESLVLALLGAVAGLGLGAVTLRLLLIWTDSPTWLDPTPDWRVALFAAGAGFAAAILFGLPPALQIARQRQRATFVRQVLIGAQVAASCVLLIVAGLLVRGLQQAVSMDPGFSYERVISVQPYLANHGFTAAQARNHVESLLGRLRSLPGIESVALVTSAPLGNHRTVASVRIDDRAMDIHVNRVDPAYFEVMKIPILRGRAAAAGEKAVVVGESLGRFQWPGEDPLGKLYGDGRYPVIGIAGSARTGALNDPDAGEVYFPIADTDWPGLIVLARSAGPTESVLPQIAAIAKATDPQILPEIQTLKSSFRRKLAGTERIAKAITALGVVALCLACLGIVGLVAFAVVQRTKEIGIRLALGARPTQVVAAILMQFSRPIAIGLLCGVGAAAALSQLLRRELFGVSHLDPLAYFAAVAIFLATAILAALWPARHALRIDLWKALRYD